MYRRVRIGGGRDDRETRFSDPADLWFGAWTAIGAWMDRPVGADKFSSELRMGPVPAGTYRCGFSSASDDGRRTWAVVSDDYMLLYGVVGMRVGCMAETAAIQWRIASPHWVRYNVTWYYTNGTFSEWVATTELSYWDAAHPSRVAVKGRVGFSYVYPSSGSRGWRQLVAAVRPGTYFATGVAEDVNGFQGWFSSQAVDVPAYGLSGDTYCRRAAAETAVGTLGSLMAFVHLYFVTAASLWSRGLIFGRRDRVAEALTAAV